MATNWAPAVARTSPGVAALDRVEAILRNPEIYELASLIPQPAGEGWAEQGLSRLHVPRVRGSYQRLLERAAGRGGALAQGRLEADAQDVAHLLHVEPSRAKRPNVLFVGVLQRGKLG